MTFDKLSPSSGFRKELHRSHKNRATSPLPQYANAPSVEESSDNCLLPLLLNGSPEEEEEAAGEDEDEDEGEDKGEGDPPATGFGKNMNRRGAARYSVFLYFFLRCVFLGSDSERRPRTIIARESRGVTTINRPKKIYIYL